MNLLLRSASPIALALALAACSTTPPTAMKPEELPGAFTAPATAGAPQDISTEWWKSFSSPEMSDLVATARINNLDLAVSAARVLQAQAQAGVAISALFPSIDLNGSAKRTGSKTFTYNTFSASLAPATNSISGAWRRTICAPRGIRRAPRFTQRTLWI